VLRDGAEYLKDKLNDAAKDLNSEVDAGLKDFIAGSDEQVRADYEAFQTGYDAGQKLGKALDDLINKSDDDPENLTEDRVLTNPDGTNSLDTTVDTAPAIDITGKVEDSSGNGLEGAGVELTTGDDSVGSLSSAPPLMNGSYDLLIPQGAAVPNQAQFEAQLLAEDGGILPVNGNVVDLTRGSQDSGGLSVSYDSDDDSDGSNIAVPTSAPAQSRATAAGRPARANALRSPLRRKFSSPAKVRVQ
jgi:hypothetical protein